MASCAFCGVTGTLTGEHVFGRWLTRIGLEREPVPHGAGRLNRVGRSLGVRRPFEQTVRDVCGNCNHGWMSQLETVARRVLTPLIIGRPGTIPESDTAAITTWAQKTALTAMLVSSEDERAGGYGLPTGEYRDLYARRNPPRPLPATQLWIGRYDGARQWAVRVTPVIVSASGLREPDRPHGYVSTIVLGHLVLHGVRFTTPTLEVPLTPDHQLARLWPTNQAVVLPTAGVVRDEDYLPLAAGQRLRAQQSEIILGPWRPATELAPSQALIGAVRLPTACGEHSAYYPLQLVDKARHGRYYAFVTSCECPHAYLIVTEADGAHCKAVGTDDDITDLYESLRGDEFVIEDPHGEFWCKRLPSQGPVIPG